MTRSVKLYMGLDVGTQGVRCVVADEEAARCWAAQSVAFGALNAAAGRGLVRAAAGGLARGGHGGGRGRAARRKLGRRGRGGRRGGGRGRGRHQRHHRAAWTRPSRPLCRGATYNDPRAESRRRRDAHAAMGGASRRELGLQFRGVLLAAAHPVGPATSGRSMCARRPRVFADQARPRGRGLLVRANARVSDDSNALKTGYDSAGRACWPATRSRSLGLERGQAAPGGAGLGREAIGRVIQAEAAVQHGAVHRARGSCGGCTDGCARLRPWRRGRCSGGRAGPPSSAPPSCSRASPGSWSSIPTGRSYFHRLPSGEWMLGGAGNIGGRCLNLAPRTGRSFDELDRRERGR